mmetsp:Transcript_5020/g.18765  ORF Transcript_5020/g.18765 Transcript_5020/m.18765 type:complete len:466 (-) Transcript_5020:41-1438(-)
MQSEKASTISGQLLLAVGCVARRICGHWCHGQQSPSHEPPVMVYSSSTCLEPMTCDSAGVTWNGKWGLWEPRVEEAQEIKERELMQQEQVKGIVYLVRLGLGGQEVRGCFSTRGAALAFQAQELKRHFGWPRQPLVPEPERSPIWDHPEELEALKEYSFHEPAAPSAGSIAARRKAIKSDRRQFLDRGSKALTEAQLKQYSDRGFLLGLPVLEPDELVDVLRDFEELLHSRIHNAPSAEARFRAAHTISRPLHQSIVARLARHKKILAIVEDILGPEFVCWSAHLFCKLPGDPTEQPWHQDAGFWPLTQSRAITLWLAFDDVDASNSSVTYIEGSHRLARLPWQPTASAHHLLTAEIPDVDLLGPFVASVLGAGEASVHSDLTVHGSRGNSSDRRRAGLALRFVSTQAECLGPMINGYRMNAGCILPKGNSDPQGHWRSLRRRPGGKRAPRFPGMASSAPVQVHP